MTIELVLTMHQRNGVPGDTIAGGTPDEARAKVRAGVAVYATKADAKEAGEPDGPTKRTAASD